MLWSARARDHNFFVHILLRIWSLPTTCSHVRNASLVSLSEVSGTVIERYVTHIGASLGWPVDQSLARQGDYLGRDSRKVVDGDDAFDLGKQTLDQTEVTACDASDRIDHGSIGVLIERPV